MGGKAQRHEKREHHRQVPRDRKGGETHAPCDQPKEGPRNEPAPSAGSKPPQSELGSAKPGLY